MRRAFHTIGLGVMLLTGGFFCSLAVLGVAPCPVAVTPGRFSLGLALSIIVPFLAALKPRPERSLLPQIVLPALIFSMPMMAMLYPIWREHETAKALALLACVAVSFGSASLGRAASR
jgi:hypothetical protein